MNSFYIAVDFLKQRLSSNENVNTFIFGQLSSRDVFKKNIYPLVHIMPSSVDFSNSQISVFSFEVACLDQRDISKQVIKDKINSNDDIQDNLNITWSILNDLITWLQRQNNDDSIELVSVTQAQPIFLEDYNGLDGWALNLTIQLINKQSVC